MAKQQNTAQLDFGLIVLDPTEHRRQLACKTRRCLSCSSDFQSTGAGNRICLRCKNLDAWSGGSIAEFAIHAAF
jgi:hypothetical protein